MFYEKRATHAITGRGRALKSSTCGDVVDGTCGVDVFCARDFEGDVVPSLQL